MNTRQENPAKPPPVLYTLFRLLLPLGPRNAAVLFWLLSAGALVGSLLLARRLLTRAGGSGLATTARPEVLAFALLIPFVHLGARYNQLAFLQVFLVLWGLDLLPERKLRAGIAMGAACALKPITLVLLPLLLWKRAHAATLGFVTVLAAAFLLVVVDVGLATSLSLHAEWFAAFGDDPSITGYHERYQSLQSFVLGSITPVFEDQVGESAPTSDWNGVRNFAASPWLWEHSRTLIALVGALVAAGCALAVRRLPAGDSQRRWLLEVGFVLAAMLLVLPTTWKHYYWFLYPALLAVLAEWRRGGSHRIWAGRVLLCAGLMLTLPHRLLPRWLWEPYHVFHGLALGCLVLWLLLLLRLRSDRGDDAVDLAPAGGSPSSQRP